MQDFQKSVLLLFDLSVGTLDLSSIRSLTILSALIAHQIFRRFETYFIRVHAFLLLGLPLLISGYDVVHNPATSTFSSIITCFSTFIMTLLASILVYRLSPLHPLAVFPGPLVNRVSKLWMAYRCISGTQARRIKALHEQYGDIVRIGPNELSSRDPAMIQPLLGTGGVPKGPHYFGHVLTTDTQNMVALQDTDEHLRRRKPWQRALAPTALKAYEDQIGVRANEIIDALEREMRGPVALEKYTERFANDFMFDMVFGGQDLLGEKDKGVLEKLFQEHVVAGMFISHIPWIADYLGSFPPIAGQIYRVVAYCEELTKRRVARGSVKKDIYHYLNHEDIQDAQPPPVQQLVDDGILALLAGSDTTGSAIATVFACLMAYQHVYEKVQAEVDRFYPPGDSPFNSQ